MPRYSPTRDSDDDDDFDDIPFDDPDEAPEDSYGSNDWPTILCPYCRNEISEDSVQCPKCGDYISKEDAPSTPKSAFWIVMMALALCCALAWTFWF